MDVAGQLVDAIGNQPLLGAQVELYPASGGLTDETYERRTVRNQSGAFNFSMIRPGRYSLLVFREGIPAPWMTSVDVGSSGLNDLRMRVPTFQQIKGHVKGIDAGSLEVALQVFQSGAPAINSKVSEDGTFVFEQVPPGRYGVMVSGNGVSPLGFPRRAAAYLAKIRFGDQAGPAISISEGGNPPLELIMSKAAGSLIGTVRDAKDNPVSESTVAVTGSGRMFQFTSKQDGSFNGDGLPPGEYKVVAYQAEYGAMPKTACDRYSSKVTVADGGASAVQLKLCTE